MSESLGALCLLLSDRRSDRVLNPDDTEVPTNPTALTQEQISELSKIRAKELRQAIAIANSELKLYLQASV
jgi:hypothetical protein